MRSPEAMELLAMNEHAFVLLYVIANRAQRTSRLNRYGLEVGQAMVGDFKNYGMTERNYRTAKKVLRENFIATFKPTSKGTIATLLDTTIFDPNLESDDERVDGQTTNERRAIDDRVTTTKKGKKVRTKGNRRVKDPSELNLKRPTGSEVVKEARKLCKQLGFDDPKEMMGINFHIDMQNSDWTIKGEPVRDWKSALRGRVQKFIRDSKKL